MTLEDAYRLYQGEIMGYLRKTYGDGDIAEDAAQQAFSKAVFSLPYLNDMPPPALRSWLYATARNAAIDMLRKRKRLQYEVDFDLLPGVPYGDPTDREALRQAMLALNDLHRNIVRMRYVEGYNASEIALALGMTAVNVRYHLMNAMKLLRNEMKEEPL